MSSTKFGDWKQVNGFGALNVAVFEVNGKTVIALNGNANGSVMAKKLEEIARMTDPDLEFIHIDVSKEADDAIRNDTKYHAERLIYDAYKDVLPGMAPDSQVIGISSSLGPCAGCVPVFMNIPDVAIGYPL
jgi:hypothetical protein